MAAHATPIEPDIDAEARRLLDLIARQDLQARLIGGMAIRLLAGPRLHPAYDRAVGDLDFVLPRRDGRALRGADGRRGLRARRAVQRAQRAPPAALPRRASRRARSTASSTASRCATGCRCRSA